MVAAREQGLAHHGRYAVAIAANSFNRGRVMSITAKLAPATVGRSNIAFLEHENIERYGSYTRLHYENRSYTNIDELLFAGRIARTLRDKDVRPGDRVFVVMPNTPELTATFQAVWTIGAVMVPVNALWSVAEFAYALDNSGAVAVLTFPTFAARIREAAVTSLMSPRLLCFGETDVAGFENIAPEVASAPAQVTPVDRAPSDIAMLLYTSGTTARPKGVVMTHQNIPATMEAVNCVNPSLPRHPILHVLPMNHIFGAILIQLSNRWGFTSVLARQFDPVTIFDAIQQHQIGYAMMVPTMLMYLLHHPDRSKYDVSSLYRVITGGASLPERLRLGIQQAFQCRVDQGYGMSETGFISCYGDHEAYRTGSAGRPCPGFEVCIMDEQGRILTPPGVGEICVQGASIMPGYWKDPAATNEAFRGPWFHTGDIGYFDGDGYLYITDRKKDLIIKGGENISPREIEEAISLHPAVADAAVVGVPDADFGEAICAVVELRPGVAATENDIREHAARHVSKFKQPAQVIFQKLPRTATGKVNKVAIREQLAGNVN
jgi:long-chain acyl-CoA synthetase